MKKYLIFLILIFSCAVVWAQDAPQPPAQQDNTQPPAQTQAPAQQPPAQKTVDPASQCNDVIKQIFDGATQYGLNLKDQPVFFTNISWLENKLKQPKEKVLTGKLYVWEEYSLYSRSDGKQSPGFDNLFKRNVTPKIITEDITQQTWECPNGSAVILSKDKENVVRDIQVTYCVNGSVMKCSVNYIDFNNDMSQARGQAESAE